MFTDNHKHYNYPENVHVKYLTFDELRKQFQEKFDFPLTLTKPYKLCDYKPAYGYVFEHLIEEFEWWGYCDCDVIFGDLWGMLAPLLEETYDKLFAVGHLTLFRNTPENNRRFMQESSGKSFYKRAFQEERNCWFDEDYWSEEFRAESIHKIYSDMGARLYTTDISFNLAVSYSQFIRTVYVGGDERFRDLPFERALYYWEDGRLMRMLVQNGRLVSEHYLYMHFQGRNMRFNESVLGEHRIQIYPNGFRKLKMLPESVEEWKRLTRYSPNFHKIQWKWKMLRKHVAKARAKKSGQT